LEEEKITLKDVLGQYIKHENGAIFHMTQTKRNPDMVLLRAKNVYKKIALKEIKQGVQDGKWFFVNEGELKRWMEVDNDYIKKFTGKLLKRNLLAQLLTELDEELVADNESDKRLQSVLNRSIKESERIAIKMYDMLYMTDKTTMHNLMLILDDMTQSISTVGIMDMPYLKMHLDKFPEQIEEYRKQPIEFVELQ
jgi:hypothetical protein